MIDPSVAASLNNATALGNETTTTTSTTTAATLTDEGAKRFFWTESEKQLILGSFFWGYVMTELPGGRLAELIGGHRVFGHSMLWSSVVTLIIPFAANLVMFWDCCTVYFLTSSVFLNTQGVTAMVILRVVLGFLLGASWPAIHPMTAVWIPPMDRSKFISNMMASALGAAITMPICGYLISWFGWPSVFYSTGEWCNSFALKKSWQKLFFTGTVGVLWSLCWFLFVFETPAKHPRISEEERKEIEDAIGKWENRHR